jgi:hypothetical protein
MLYYPRTPLASSLADALQGKDVFSDAPNGLFLAAPRRTGKSTFLQADLMPELQRRHVVVVYVDLWADQKRDPGSLIAEAVGQALLKQLGVVAKTAKLAGLDSINVAGIKIDTSKIGKVDGSTLTDALRALSEASKAPVALVIDEAQHALTSEAGETAMAALKSARDQLNRPGEVRLMLVMSGSDRDKLLRLVNTNAAPFYGSQIHRMPELGPTSLPTSRNSSSASVQTWPRSMRLPWPKPLCVSASGPSFLWRHWAKFSAHWLPTPAGLKTPCWIKRCKNKKMTSRKWKATSQPCVHWSKPCCGACWSWVTAFARMTPTRSSSTTKKRARKSLLPRHKKPWKACVPTNPA